VLALRQRHGRRQSGTTLIEVLITIVILAFGLLGLAGLQSKMHLVSAESYQRAHAVLLLSDMKERMSANRKQAGAYVSTDALGTGDAQPADCSAIPVGMERDRCLWSNALKGASESDSSGNVGAMIDARGCITQVQAPDPTLGVCAPGIYQITVAWQGMYQTKAPEADCGKDLYGDDKQRRVISELVSVGLPTCY
jgi:type IV pilus assembly protein PilV